MSEKKEKSVAKKNNRMNHKSYLLLLALIIILCSIALIRGVFHKKKKEEDIYWGVVVDNIDMKEERVFNCADSSSECSSNVTYYRTYESREKYPALSDALEKINKKTKQSQLEEQKHLTEDDPACENVRNRYKYRYMTSNWMDYYELDVRDIVSVVIEREKTDFCTGETTLEDEVYNYSKKDDKIIIDTDELLERYGYTKEELNEIILKYSKNHLDQDVDVSLIKDYRLSFHFDGMLIVEYQLEDSNQWYICKNE